MQLTKVQDVVEIILTRDPMTRDSDDYLYVKVLEYMKAGITELSFIDVMGSLKKYHLPSYESVGRARRKLQASKPWLQASDNVKKLRIDNENKYSEYARKEIR